MVKCPFCGHEGFKELREPWKYGFYTVRMLECPRCYGVFNYYDGVSPRGKRSAFVIRIRPKKDSNNVWLGGYINGAVEASWVGLE